MTERHARLAGTLARHGELGPQVNGVHAAGKASPTGTPGTAATPAWGKTDGGGPAPVWRVGGAA